MSNVKMGKGGAPVRASTIPTEPAERKKFPVASGVLDYFPDALVAVSQVSYLGNEQHNPGQPLHWARGKSMDQDDTIIRHFLERGGRDTDGQRHSAKLAWRALALLQLEIEAERAAPPISATEIREREREINEQTASGAGTTMPSTSSAGTSTSGPAGSSTCRPRSCSRSTSRRSCRRTSSR